MSVFEWAVIGAGPAGIAAVGNLLDQGVPAKSIVWIDPQFAAGDFGSKWREVSSNTKVELFLNFFNACRSFDYELTMNSFSIHQLDRNETCLLKEASAPLLWITKQLQTKVVSYQEHVIRLEKKNAIWEIITNIEKRYAKHVILAIGSEPNILSYDNKESIALETALNPKELKNQCLPHDVIAVFGSSHSAILILKTLLEDCSVNKVINFYRAPLRYAVYYKDYILYDDTGLKGIAAEWARKNIDGIIPEKLERFTADNENIKAQLPYITKVIAAVGFKKRSITVNNSLNFDYDPQTGEIAPSLFGIGIAFPEAKENPMGEIEHRVGLWKFMDYLQRVMPLWLDAPI